MKVGFDGTSLTLRRSGIGRYTLELAHALMRHEPALELKLMAHKSLSTDLADDPIARLPRLGRPQLPAKVVWMQTVLPLTVGRRDVDLCHFTNYHAALAMRVPFVVNIHDMSLITMPGRHPAKRVISMRPLLRAAARRAAAVLTLTESARSDAIEHLGLPPAKVHVVPAAAAPGFGRIDDAALLSDVASRLGVRDGCLLFVGTIEPRKNIPRLLEAYARLRAQGFDKQLVICGGQGWKSPEIGPLTQRLGVADHVVFTGFVPDSDVVGLLNLCGTFVYPSLYEGYGLPIIEALACGAPTVTSNRGATAEVAGDAALLVEPEDVDALVAALSLALFDEPTRSRLRAAGLRRSAAFTWERAAHETAAINRRVVEAGA
jgi:glycosyltransferase involved in cell wall biosynthesis